MKFLATGKEVKWELNRLLKKCQHIRWAVAWASTTAPGFNLLFRHREKIEQLTVGTDSYGTHPAFINKFKSLGSSKVQFVKSSKGTFHPKLYYFDHGGGCWNCIIGSANFTKPAFDINSEVAVSISSNDGKANVVERSILNTLDSYSKLETINEDDIKTYKEKWEKLQEQRRSDMLSGTSSSPLNMEMPSSGDSLLTKNWQEYYELVKEECEREALRTALGEKITLKGRLRVLEAANRLFKERKHFSNFSEDERCWVAGFRRTEEIDWLLFGSTKGNGRFKHEVISNNPLISEALDRIPLEDDVTEEHFKSFLEPFCKAIDRGAEKPNPIALATRLLVCKRPDYFVSFNDPSKDEIFDEIGCIRSTNIDNYWSEVIDKTLNSKWRNSPKPRPENTLEQRIWRCRVAMLDAFFYNP